MAYNYTDAVGNNLTFSMVYNVTCAVDEVICMKTSISYAHYGNGEIQMYSRKYNEKRLTFLKRGSKKSKVMSLVHLSLRIMHWVEQCTE